MPRIVICLVAATVVHTLSANAQTTARPVAPKTSVQASPTTAEQYRDAIIAITDAAYLLQGTVLTGLTTVDGKRCFGVDSAKAKAAALTTVDLQKKWSEMKAPDTLKTSHKEMLDWLSFAQAQFGGLPSCLEGGSMPLLAFFGIFGKYDTLRKDAGAVLEGLGVTLKEMEKKNQ